MTVTLSDSGAIVTEGRGSAKAVILDVDFKSLEVWAARTGKSAAELWRRAYGSACRNLRLQLAKVMRLAGGVYGVPKFRSFEAFTNELRAVTNRTSPMGGVLADKRRIVAYKRNGWQIIGWPDSLEKTAIAFQEGEGGSAAEKFLTSSKSRAYMHRRGIRDIPREYTHNPRRVIPEPFGEHVRQNLDTWAKTIYFKRLATMMARNARGV